MSDIAKAAFLAAQGIGDKPLDSKYRLIIVAALRSKQLQRGARPRVDLDNVKHKATRVALAEVMAGKVTYTKRDESK